MRKLILIVGGAALAVAVQAPRAVAQAPASFWQQLGDSVLARLVNEAVRNGPSVRGAEARLDEVRASHRLAAFDFAPTVTASGSALRTRQSMAQVPGLTTPLPERDLYDVGFDA